MWDLIYRWFGPKPMNPYDSAEYVHGVAKNVRVDWDGIRAIGCEIYEAVMEGRYSLRSWREHPLHPKTLCDNTINWIFLVDSLNFSFWPDKGQEYAVTWRGVEYTGYWALCAAINRALDQGIPICDPSYYGHLSLEQTIRILKAHRPGKPKEPIDMPMMKERHKIMREHGKELMRTANNYAALIVVSRNSCLTLLQKTLRDFKSFRDTVTYNDKKLSFNKRAQILVADIYCCYENEGIGHFVDIDELTAFADYRVPQILYYFNAITYKNELIARIKAGEVMAYGDADEIEIRAGAIYAVEKIKHHVRRLGRRNKIHDLQINSILVDFWLWDNRRLNSEAIDAKLPHHRTRSIYY